jgi:hypothetical protein
MFGIKKLEERINKLEAENIEFNSQRKFILKKMNELNCDPICITPEEERYGEGEEFIALCRTIKKLQNQLDFVNTRGIPDYQSQIDDLKKTTQKHDKAIEEILEVLEPILIKNCRENLDSVVGEFEKALKELFGSETAKTRKKCVKSSAEKCKKCGETKKGEEKCSVAKKKSKKS